MRLLGLAMALRCVRPLPPRAFELHGVESESARKVFASNPSGFRVEGSGVRLLSKSYEIRGNFRLTFSRDHMHACMHVCMRG
jgi:hypothetical protein